MRQLADRIYFTAKRYLKPVNENEAYDAGFTAGYEIARARIMSELQRRSLYEFNSDELRLGYDFAVETAKKAGR